MSKKVVLGFSGGLDTTFCVKYLTEEKGYEVHSIIVNTGGFNDEELEKIEQHAYKLGVKTHTTINAIYDYYNRIIKYLIYGNCLKNNTYPLSVSAERLSQALHIAEHVKKLNPTFVSKLHPDCIQNISKEQIPYLTNPAAILQIPLELFDNPNLTPADFGDTVLSNLSATQCNRIHSSSLIERISALKPDQGKYFQPKYTRYLTLESFRANFNFFKQEHFDFLSQEQINLLTPEMVINLKKTNRILLLSFKQLFNALPPETMRSYPINQIECLNYIEKQELFDELPEAVIQKIREVHLLNKLSKKATQKDKAKISLCATIPTLCWRFLPSHAF